MKSESTIAEIVAEAERLAADIEKTCTGDAKLRAKLLEIFGLWLVVARTGGGRARWDEILESVFPWPSAGEIESAHAHARKRLGLN